MTYIYIYMCLPMSLYEIPKSESTNLRFCQAQAAPQKLLGTGCCSIRCCSTTVYMCEICVKYVWNMWTVIELYFMKYFLYFCTQIDRSDRSPFGWVVFPFQIELIGTSRLPRSMSPWVWFRPRCLSMGCEITMDRHEGLLAIFQKAFWKIAMAYHFNILAISIPTFAGVLPKVLPFFMKPEQLRYIGGLFFQWQVICWAWPGKKHKDHKIPTDWDMGRFFWCRKESMVTRPITFVI